MSTLFSPYIKTINRKIKIRFYKKKIKYFIIIINLNLKKAII